MLPGAIRRKPGTTAAVLSPYLPSLASVDAYYDPATRVEFKNATKIEGQVRDSAKVWSVEPGHFAEAEKARPDLTKETEPLAAPTGFHSDQTNKPLAALLEPRYRGGSNMIAGIEVELGIEGDVAGKVVGEATSEAKVAVEAGIVVHGGDG